jgi:hypothetical protein
MLPVLTAILALQAFNPTSPLIANGPASNYRALVIIAPIDGKQSWTMNEVRGGSLVDVGHIRRQRDGSYRIPVLFVRARVLAEPDREIIIYHDATVRCGSDYDSGLPSYETVAGPTPLRADMDWRPSLSDFELGLVSDIVCTPKKQGWVIGRLTRDELVNLFDPDTAESIEALERSYREARQRDGADD